MSLRVNVDDGKATEYNTLLVTDWFAHTPPDILALNFGLPAETFAKIPLHQLYIFQGQMPGPLVPVAGANHFSILEELRRPGGLLVRTAQAILGDALAGNASA